MRRLRLRWLLWRYDRWPAHWKRLLPLREAMPDDPTTNNAYRAEVGVWKALFETVAFTDRGEQPDGCSDGTNGRTQSGDDEESSP